MSPGCPLTSKLTAMLNYLKVSKFNWWMSVLLTSDRLHVLGIENPNEQKQCLDLGKEVGLDVAIITKSVVEHIRNTGMVSNNLMDGELFFA